MNELMQKLIATFKVTGDNDINILSRRLTLISDLTEKYIQEICLYCEQHECAGLPLKISDIFDLIVGKAVSLCTPAQLSDYYNKVLLEQSGRDDSDVAWRDIEVILDSVYDESRYRMSQDAQVVDNVTLFGNFTLYHKLCTSLDEIVNGIFDTCIALYDYTMDNYETTKTKMVSNVMPIIQDQSELLKCITVNGKIETHLGNFMKTLRTDLDELHKENEHKFKLGFSQSEYERVRKMPPDVLQNYLASEASDNSHMREIKNLYRFKLSVENYLSELLEVEKMLGMDSLNQLTEVAPVEVGQVVEENASVDEKDANENAIDTLENDINVDEQEQNPEEIAKPVEEEIKAAPKKRRKNKATQSVEPGEKCDEVQLHIISHKCGRVFIKLKHLYHNSHMNNSLVNQGIAVKISKQYGIGGHLESERNKIAMMLNEIHFIDFFAGTKNTNSKDRKLFFWLKSPSEMKLSKSTKIKVFVRNALFKYCDVTSTQRLVTIFTRQLNERSLTDVKFQFRQALLQAVSKRCTLLKRFLAFINGGIELRNMETAFDLKQQMLSMDVSMQNNGNLSASKDFQSLQILRSAAMCKDHY